VVHADETGIDKGGGRFWLHCVSNLFWTLKPIGGSWGKSIDKESDRNKAVKRDVKYANE
jgi:hypothetical protein